MDSYQELFDSLKITKEQFLEIGIRDILQANDDVLKTQWKKQKDGIFSTKTAYTIRKYGKNGDKLKQYEVFYKHLLGCKIKIDPNNNTAPTKRLTDSTPYRKNSKTKSKKYITIYNYQVSHIYERTKNPLLFTAAWNLAYIPKYLDPFTGHETKGILSDDLRLLFQKAMFEKLSFFIDEYNYFVSSKIEPEINSAFDETEKKLKSSKFFTPDKFNQFKKDATSQWEIIKPPP